MCLHVGLSICLSQPINQSVYLSIKCISEVSQAVVNTAGRQLDYSFVSSCLFIHSFVFVCLFVCFYACMFVCMYVCLFICLYVCLFAFLFVCMHVCWFACLFVRMFLCLHVCMFVCLYVRMFVRLFVLSSSVQTHCLSAFHTYTCLSAVTPDKHNTNQDTKSETPTCHINLYPHCCTRPSLTIADIALVHTIIRISDILDHEVRYHINWPSIKTLIHIVDVN